MGTSKNGRSTSRKKLDQTLAEHGNLGDASSSPGSQEWAISVRNSLQDLLKQNQSSATYLKDMLALMDEHQGYKLLHKENTESFQGLEEFCRERQPWGLGHALELIDRIVEERESTRRKRMLEELPAAQQGERTDLTSYHDDRKLAEITANRLRAIKERAPAIVRELYEEDLIGVEAAVSLGPRKPSPRRQEVIEEITQHLESLPRPKSREDRRQFKREVNQFIYQHEEGRPALIADDPAAVAKTLATRFKGERLQELITHLQNLLE